MTITSLRLALWSSFTQYRKQNNIYHFKVAHDTYSAGYYGNKSSGHRKIEKRFARGNLHGSQAG